MIHKFKKDGTGVHCIRPGCLVGLEGSILSSLTQDVIKDAFKKSVCPSPVTIKDVRQMNTQERIDAIVEQAEEIITFNKRIIDYWMNKDYERDD